MGAGSTLANVLLFLTALERVLGAAVTSTRRRRSCEPRGGGASIGAQTRGLRGAKTRCEPTTSPIM